MMTERKTLGKNKAADRLFAASGLNTGQIYSKYSLNGNGLSDEEAYEHRERFGSNEIERKKRDSLPKRLFRAFVNPFTVVLFVLTGISLFTDILIPPPDERNYMTVIMVVTMVFISGLMTFFQESRSEKSAEKLQAMVRSTAAVLRNGKRREIPMD